jgi:predicted PurR-regulated permease PerM
MAVIIVIILIGTILIIDSIREFNQNIQRIKELENRLEQYYKEREKRLKDKGLIK